MDIVHREFKFSYELLPPTCYITPTDLPASHRSPFPPRMQYDGAGIIAVETEKALSSSLQELERYGGTEAWRYGGMEEWRYGGMEAWMVTCTVS